MLRKHTMARGQEKTSLRVTLSGCRLWTLQSSRVHELRMLFAKHRRMDKCVHSHRAVRHLMYSSHLAYDSFHDDVLIYV